VLVVVVVVAVVVAVVAAVVVVVVVVLIVTEILWTKELSSGLQSREQTGTTENIHGTFECLEALATPSGQGIFLTRPFSFTL
jgi:hypothetical protein